MSTRRTGKMLLAALGLGALTLSAFSVPAASAVGSSASQLAPHRAFYTMSLGERRSGADIVDVEGGLAFEWSDACEGWTILQQATMTFDYDSGVSVRVGWVFSTWEAKDGLSYQFTIRRTRNGEVTEEVRGSAELDGPGEGGLARFSVPAEESIPLAPGTVFPSQHTFQLIDAARSGEFTYLSEVFDGSAMEPAMVINAVISRARPHAEGMLDNTLILEDVWPIHLAFFPADSQSAEPEHQQRLMVQENGVVRHLALDYGDFTVGSELTRLESLPSDC